MKTRCSESELAMEQIIAQLRAQLAAATQRAEKADREVNEWRQELAEVRNLLTDCDTRLTNAVEVQKSAHIDKLELSGLLEVGEIQAERVRAIQQLKTRIHNYESAIYGSHYPSGISTPSGSDAAQDTAKANRPSFEEVESEARAIYEAVYTLKYDELESQYKKDFWKAIARVWIAKVAQLRADKARAESALMEALQLNKNSDDAIAKALGCPPNMRGLQLASNAEAMRCRLERVGACCQQMRESIERIIPFAASYRSHPLRNPNDKLDNALTECRSALSSSCGSRWVYKEELKPTIKDAISTIEKLAQQQAMPDDFYRPTLTNLQKLMNL